MKKMKIFENKIIRMIGVIVFILIYAVPVETALLFVFGLYLIKSCAD